MEHARRDGFARITRRAARRQWVSRDGGSARAIDGSGGSRCPASGTGSPEFDRVLGGGIVPGTLMLVGGDPGIGKVTLLIADRWPSGAA